MKELKWNDGETKARELNSLVPIPKHQKSVSISGCKQSRVFCTGFKRQGTHERSMNRRGAHSKIT